MSSRVSLRALWVKGLGAAALALGSAVAAPAQALPSYLLFESGQVRPLAMTPDGETLLAVNTPDNRLEVFRVTSAGLQHRGSVPVGLEPTAVSVRNNEEAWVVNHLSDSVSVVNLSQRSQPRVVRTLLVGDEPRDIVFAGPSRARAFITTAHRGQNSPIDPALYTPGVGRADVWVFDAANLGSSLGGNPVTIITLFSDTPRALAVTPDGSRVYAAAFMSGNRTTTVINGAVPDGGEAAGGVPAPNTNASGIPQPDMGLIVKFNGQHWVDEIGRVWDDKVRFSLPDKDVFVIDANANPPAELPGAGGFFTGVGTVLFNMAINPVSGKVYVSNTEARNEERFEGPGTFAGHTLRGHLHESRITVLDGQAAAPRHLNKHVNYTLCCEAAPNDEAEKSLATPLEMAVSSDGETLYVAAFGSSKIGVFSTSELESDTFVPDEANQIEVSGGGPSGVVLDEARGRLYSLTRFDNSISIIDTAARAEVGKVPMYNPEPPSVVGGRRFLYDARATSSHGDSSCSSCHVFGDLDSLAWDLGNPDDEPIDNPGPFFLVPPPPNPKFQPMKGPMTTQSLRGLANHGPMHWRGDRTGGNDAPSAQPDSGSFDEVAAFEHFNEAFTSLLGRDSMLAEAEMQAFTDFVLELTYPPNPIRALDNSLTPEQAAGRDIYMNQLAGLGIVSCNDCHTLDSNGNAAYGVDRPGFFGTSGSSVLGILGLGGQSFKIPHLRNLYQKVGMFGDPPDPDLFLEFDTSFMGDQIRGFGVMHDGSLDTLERLHASPGFSQTATNPDGFALGPAGNLRRRQVAAFLLAFDSNLAPIVGQQITLNGKNALAVSPRIDLLVQRAAAGECDLVAKGREGARVAGYLYQPGAGTFLQDRAGAPPLPRVLLSLKALLPKHEITFTCAPPGSGVRMGIDRDSDGFRDGDELTFGSDPADPTSTP
jgi:DNA-binding beta-propeller fold protein YncE